MIAAELSRRFRLAASLYIFSLLLAVTLLWLSDRLGWPAC
jgi:hypothetical protein